VTEQGRRNRKWAGDRHPTGMERIWATEGPGELGDTDTQLVHGNSG
jgi:hypothetical protein